MKRCPWGSTEPLLIEYHDKEWGVPVREDRKLFEFLTLEGMQAGLNWLTVLKKRDNFRRTFAGFNPRKVATFTSQDVRNLLRDTGIIRNRLKIKAAINNASRFLEIQDEYGSFSDYVWQFTGGKPVRNRFRTLSAIPAKTAESDAMSRALQKRGFSFVGSTICYAFMQAVGMTNDHITTCFRYTQV